MSETDYMKILIKELTPQKLNEFNTTILIGKSAKLTKKLLRRGGSGYRTITTADDVRAFLDYYSTPTDAPIVFEDPSKMTPSVQAYLLKFIEEPPAPLVILASKDSLSPVLLSRCKRCIKFPEDIKHGDKPLREFTETKAKAEEEYILWQNTDPKEREPLTADILGYIERLDEMALQNCPYYWYVKSGVVANISHLDKFIGLL